MRDIDQAPRRPRASNRRISKAANFSAGRFYIVLGVGILIAVCLHFEVLKPSSGSQLLQLRNVSKPDNDDDTCRMVHKAADQCRYIKRHCPLNEAGFTEYLDLYFCQLAHVKPIAFILLTAWLGLLFSTIGIASSDFFCVDLSTMAKILGMSESMAGVTLLAFGNGSPDVFSTFAAMSTDSGDLAVGELMGAACFITAVVAGSMAIIRPFKVSKRSFVRDVAFFAVAAAFTMVILSDGILHLWECLAMIGYYVFYVCFVLFWHWIEARRKRRYDTEAAARGHYTPVDGPEDRQPYTDEQDVETLRPSTIRAPSSDDFAALERSVTEDDGDYSDEERDRWLSELNTNMRLSRAATRSRSKTIAPVRPSLVGALEFQAVLKTLQKSRNMQSVPLSARRYSEDPNLRAYDLPDQQATHRRSSVNHDASASTRPSLHVDIPHGSPDRNIPHTAVEARGRPLDDDLQRRGQGRHHTTTHVTFRAPTIEVSQSSPQSTPTENMPTISIDANTNRMQPRSSKSEDFLSHRKLLNRLNSPNLSPQGSPRGSPHIMLPSPPRSRSSTRAAQAQTSPFPAYTDEPSDRPSSPLEHLALPSPVMSTSSETLSQAHNVEVSDAPPSLKQWRWWPYGYLPPPESLACVLFPTMTDWQDKSLWAKSLSLVAAPSVFLLTITLPVVESDTHVESEQPPLATASPLLPQSTKPNVLDSSQSTSGSDSISKFDGDTPTSASVMTAVGRQHMGTDRESSFPDADTANTRDNPLKLMQQAALAEDWPRWLLLIQLYTAPFTIVLAVFIQSPETLPASWLLRPGLVSLLISTVLLVPVLLTTTPSYRPRQYRWILSLVGFAVSIAWISTIASQVVGTLKALAIILNWSNAIMGLTIFAVGNSVSDLVADMTVANLGYPVMALSACFGGPMLNILLGIGLSGTYTILHGAERRKHRHPDKGFKTKAYHLDVGKTLVVSGISLLITLVICLTLVPASNWMMTRRIGIALIIIWILSTIGNVVIEVTDVVALS